MEGKRGLVFGVANKMSISWAISKALVDNGAVVGLNYLNQTTQRRVTKLAQTIDIDFVQQCDVQSEEDVRKIIESFYKTHGPIDFIVHAIAFAELDGDGLIGTERNNFLKTMNVSVFSLINICHHARAFFSKSASVLTLTYLGAERVCVGYDAMGVAKAALNSSCRYLAQDLGPLGIRVNAISAGPLRTSAAIGIPAFKEMLAKTAYMSPLRRNITHEEVANTAIFLLSEMSAGITGEVINVDCGYNIMGTWRGGEIEPSHADKNLE